MRAQVILIRSLVNTCGMAVLSIISKGRRECINLGLVFENETTTEGMAHILESLHKYVKDFDEKVVFGGDQLNEERAAGVQRLRQNGATPQARLAGLLPTA